MGILEINNLTHSFGDKTLYKEASFELFKGEHMGLVGQNGAGKSTLLTSLVGNLTPDSGDIRWQRGVKVGYLDQYAKVDKSKSILEYLKTAFDDLYEVEKELGELYEQMAVDFADDLAEKASNYQSLLLNRGFYEVESTILKVCDGLGITSLGVNTTVFRLSGGQRAKVILAKLLLQKPDVLLLDEPTNFLDKEHVDWLSDYLKDFENAFIIISHNFDFLDKVTNCILDIEFGKVIKYSGNFSKFMDQKGLKREGYLKAYQAQQKVIKKHEDYIARNKTRASTAKMAQSRVKMLNKIDRMTPPKSPPKPRFHFKSTSYTMQKHLVVKNLEIGYQGPLLPELNFVIKPAEKIAIVGFNGIGKSTLLKTLIGQIPPLNGSFAFNDCVKIGYFEQDLKWQNPQMTPLEIVKEKFSRMLEKDVRKSLAQCGVFAKNVAQPIVTLSGGEQSKVKLCILMLTKCNFLILDEPTNHLDADTKEALQKQLDTWEGTLILVSHEESFYKDFVDRVANISTDLNKKIK